MTFRKFGQIGLVTNLLILAIYLLIGASVENIAYNVFSALCCILLISYEK